ncbi:MAG: lytic transglycosylase domain-containing protein [Vampirovibrionales bacterium]
MVFTPSGLVPYMFIPKVPIRKGLRTGGFSSDSLTSAPLTDTLVDTLMPAPEQSIQQIQARIALLEERLKAIQPTSHAGVAVQQRQTFETLLQALNEKAYATPEASTIPPELTVDWSSATQASQTVLRTLPTPPVPEKHSMFEEDDTLNPDFLTAQHYQAYYYPKLARVEAPSEVWTSVSSRRAVTPHTGMQTLQLQNLAHEVAQKHQLNPSLFKALVQAESGFRTKARSYVGAMGLTQLMPKTAKSLGVKNPWNPAENLEGGAKYLKGLIDRFGGSEQLALAAYNAGPNAVKRYGGIPPYRETMNYVKRIMKLQRDFASADSRHTSKTQSIG